MGKLSAWIFLMPCPIGLGFMWNTLSTNHDTKNMRHINSVLPWNEFICKLWKRPAKKCSNPSKLLPAKGCNKDGVQTNDVRCSHHGCPGLTGCKQVLHDVAYLNMLADETDMSWQIVNFFGVCEPTMLRSSQVVWSISNRLPGRHLPMWMGQAKWDKVWCLQNPFPQASWLFCVVGRACSFKLLNVWVGLMLLIET